MEDKSKWKETELSLDFIKTIFTYDRLLNTERILLCGGQGDPIYCKDFLKIIKYLKAAKPELGIQIVTNGSYKKKEWWNELARLLNGYDDITFSVDGWDDKSNNLYRSNSNFKSILTGVNIMGQSKAIVRWSTILFRFNQKYINKIENVANKNRADYFDLTLSTLFASIVGDYLIDPVLGYDPLEPDKTLLSKGYKSEKYSKHLSDKKLINNNYNKRYNKLFSEIKEIKKDCYITPLCESGNRGLYIDAEGIMYPCSWVSHPFTGKHSSIRGKIIEWKDSLFVHHKDKFNLNTYNVDDILTNDYWKKLQTSWNDKDKSFVECERKCLNSNTTLNSVKRKTHDNIKGL